MNRRKFVEITTVASAAVVAGQATAAEKKAAMTLAELDTETKKGGAKVAAIKPTSDALSKDDEALMMEVALGGMMQLEVSKVAEKMATAPEVKALAAAEVEEQTGLSMKLKEIAAAKKVMLPEKPDEKTEKEVQKLSALSGAEFDKAYVQDSGIKGHQMLDKTMTKVKSEAKDANLKAIEAAAHPLVALHLEYAKGAMMMAKK